MSRFTRLADRVEKIHGSTHVLVTTETPVDFGSGDYNPRDPQRGIVKTSEFYPIGTILLMLVHELGYEIEGIPRQRSSIKLVKKDEE